MKKIVFLHHSTGQIIWQGKTNKYISKLTQKSDLKTLFNSFNKKNKTSYVITQRIFPKGTPYGWHNYPYDYYNIWVKNSGNVPFMKEPTLEMLTKEYQVVIFKHCFPVSNIQIDKDISDVNSDYKSIANYKLQYLALRDKLAEFPDTKFILFTGAALIKSEISEDKSKRAKEFFEWVINEWDLPDNNIYIWDLYNLQTEGGLYFKDKYAAAADDSHPNKDFSGYVVKLLFNRIIDVIDFNGTNTKLTGEWK
jgi:hypothetical protein